MLTILTVGVHVSLSFSLLVAACCLLITFANSLDPDQDRQNIGPDIGSQIIIHEIKKN